MASVVILANGDFPSADKPLERLKEADIVICCDGAAINLIEYGRKPDYVVGDLDSLPEGLKRDLADCIVHIEEQESNDLTKAFNFALTLHPERIDILGATGKREDHTLGNISLLIDYTREAACPVEMFTDFGRFIAFFSSGTFHTDKGGQVSIFAFDPTLKIKSAGLVYPTDEVIFNSLWKATLNEAASTEFSLSLSHPSGCLLFFADSI